VLVALANESCCQLYCGRSADGRSVDVVLSERLPSVTGTANPNLGQDANLAEAIFNLANNGVLSRIDERGQRCHDLFQWVGASAAGRSPTGLATFVLMLGSVAARRLCTCHDYAP
jgi:hypothetical protein